MRAAPTVGSRGDAGRPLRVRIGLGYVRGVTEQEVTELVAVREAGGRFRTLADLASRASSSAASLEMLAWSGACDSLVQGAPAGSERRIALWQLGVATPGTRVPGGVQLALPLDLPAPPELRALTPWESMLADYGTIGLTAHSHPIALLRDRLPDDLVTSRELKELRHGTRRQGGRAGGGASASRHGERDRVRAARGRVRDDQPDRSRRRSTSATG